MPKREREPALTVKSKPDHLQQIQDIKLFANFVTTHRKHTYERTLIAWHHWLLHTRRMKNGKQEACSTTRRRIANLGKSYGRMVYQGRSLADIEDMIVCSQLERWTERQHTEEGGCRRAPWCIGKFLFKGLEPVATTERDQRYQVLWWLHVASGQRPNTIFHARAFTLYPTELHVERGRSKEQIRSTSRHAVYPYRWSCPPPSFAAHYLKDVKNIRLAKTDKQLGVNLYSWLRKWYATHHHTEVFPSAMWARVRMDNILWHYLVKEDLLSEREFSFLMGHEVETAMQSYRRSEPPINPLDSSTWEGLVGKVPKRLRPE